MSSEQSSRQLLPTQYQPRSYEDAVYARWEASGLFQPREREGGMPPYVIPIPPPNITGALHIGHALNNGLQDLLIRWRRMQGRPALWLPGSDHAGIATQNVVEKQIARTEKRTRYQLGRAELLRRIWAWREEYGGTILKQLRKLGASCDWSRTRFTLDEGCTRAVRTAFIRLHQRGLIYRGKYLVNWCPRCRTTLSDDEVEHEEVLGRLYELHYPLANPAAGRDRLTVATTRPETMLGDTAVAVHPQDERHRALVGARVRLPLADREIPIVADAALELGFGTGCLKVTPAHDPVDYQIARRHKLELINIFTEDGRLNENVPPQFRGLDRFAARKAVLEALKARGLVGQVADHKHQVGHCYRCRTMIEPYLTAQWFVSMKPLSESAVKATQEGRVKFHPERWTKVYLQWFQEVRDWPISRQIWWGHQVPVWYCLEDNRESILKFEAGPDEPCDVEEGGRRYRYLIGEQAAPIVPREGEEDPARRPEFQGKTLIRDPDVLDTWFSSALWPFSTLGWPERTADLERFFPTSTLVTSRGIIYFWVARMVMLSEFLMGKEPFRDVVIHGTVLDGEGEVMSKSKGNGIDPLDMVSRYGADAVRFAIFDMATEGQDIRFPVQIVCPHCGESQPLPKNRQAPAMNCRKCRKEFQQPVPNEPLSAAPPAPPPGVLDSKRFEKGRNFANKVWNAGRYVLTSLDPASAAKLEAGQILSGLKDEDRWILSRLNHAARNVTGSLEAFEFSKAANALYTFFWDDFCAWTIELSKPRLAAGPETSDASVAAAVLLHVLDRSLRLLHPFCPFITEVLWAELAGLAPEGPARNLGRSEPSPAAPAGKSFLASAAWPQVETEFLKPELEARFEALFEAVRAVRNIRQKNGIRPDEKLKVGIRTREPAAAERLLAQQHILIRMANLQTPSIGPEVPKPRPAGHEVLAGADLYVDLAGLMDVAGERARLEKERERASAAVKQSEARLADARFVQAAPPDKVKAERVRLAEYREKARKLEEALRELE